MCEIPALFTRIFTCPSSNILLKANLTFSWIETSHRYALAFPPSRAISPTTSPAAASTQRIASCFQMNNLLDRNYLKCPGICVAHSNYQCTWSGPLSSVDRLQVLEDSQSLLGVRIIRLQVQRGPQLLLRFVDLAGSSIEQPEVPVQVRAL